MHCFDSAPFDSEFLLPQQSTLFNTTYLVSGAIVAIANGVPRFSSAVDTLPVASVPSGCRMTPGAMVVLVLFVPGCFPWCQLVSTGVYDSCERNVLSLKPPAHLSRLH